MNCSCFQKAGATSPQPNPTKHVRFTEGMVLGVDDFTQDFAYLSGRDQWLARDAVGYGTLSGLAVRLEKKGDQDKLSTRLRVTAGTALTPRGQLVRVPCDQCAELTEWLKNPDTHESIKKHHASNFAADELRKKWTAAKVKPLFERGMRMLIARRVGADNGAAFEAALKKAKDSVEFPRIVASAPLEDSLANQPEVREYIATAIEAEGGREFRRAGSLVVHVVLCYRDCAVDPQPIPGEPCRCESELMAESRWQDDFRLELRLETPDQTEEDAVRKFVAWLREHIAVTQTKKLAPDKVEAIAAKLVGGLAEKLETAKQEADRRPINISHPAPVELVDGKTVNVPADNLCEFLRIAFRIWVTSIRPRFQADCFGGACDCGCADEKRKGPACPPCLLLGTLTLPLNEDFTLSDTPALDERARPFVLNLRALQEWLLCGKCCDGGGEGPAPETPDLDGDTEGPPQENAVIGIQTRPIEGEPKTDGDILTFIGQKKLGWRPLGQDVQGPPNEAEVVGVQGVPIQGTRAEKSKEGAVLTVVGDGDHLEWRKPETPESDAKDVVLRSKGSPPYAIVAAGIIGVQFKKGKFITGIQFEPRFQGPEFLDAGQPLMALLSFDGYSDPDQTDLKFDKGFTYIAKLTLFSPTKPQKQKTMVQRVSVLELTPKGILIQFEPELSLEGSFTQFFMVEVSQYWAKP